MSKSPWFSKAKYLLLLLPVFAVFQNCGRTETLVTGENTESSTDPIQLTEPYIDVRSTSKLGYNNFLGGSCSELSFTVKSKNGQLGFSEETTSVALGATLFKPPVTSVIDDSLFMEQITYASIDDCRSNVNGASQFILPAKTNVVRRWTIFATKDATKQQDSRMIRLQIENPLFKAQYYSSLGSYGNINAVSDSELLLYLSGPELVQKDACVAYDVGYMNFKGELFNLPVSGYYFSNYSLNGDSPYEAFSDANCKSSILAQKNVMLNKIFLKFYKEPYTERANPTIVVVVPGNQTIIKVGWLIVWTKN